MPSVIKPSKVKLSQKQTPIHEYSWQSSPDLAAAANLSDLGLNIRSLAQGQLSYPYHFHHNSDELFIIISGSGQLRTPDGIQHVGPGDIAMFEKGKSGAHQLYNPNDQPLLYIDIASRNDCDVCEYPDSGKINVLPVKQVFRNRVHADYWDGEEKPLEKWRMPEV